MSWLTLRTRRSERTVTTAGAIWSTTPAYDTPARGERAGGRGCAADAAADDGAAADAVVAATADPPPSSR